MTTNGVFVATSSSMTWRPVEPVPATTTWPESESMALRMRFLLSACPMTPSTRSAVTLPWTYANVPMPPMMIATVSGRAPGTCPMSLSSPYPTVESVITVM